MYATDRSLRVPGAAPPTTAYRRVRRPAQPDDRTIEIGPDLVVALAGQVPTLETDALVRLMTWGGR
jgi:hypothetical protein